METHSLRVLEYDKIIGRLAALASNQLGREAALALVPSPFPEIVRRRLQETREARALLAEESGMPLGGIRDIREPVERAAIDAVLTPRELLDTGQTCASATRLRAYLQKRRESTPLLAEIASNLPTVQKLELEIAATIAESAEVRDSASPELARIRSQKKVVHARLLDRLQSMLGSEKYRDVLQEAIVTQREGRYCLPVKAEFKARLGGIVHDASASGATLFVEPGACVELGNELKELFAREEHEVTRILLRLTRLIGAQADDLRTMLRMLANLDLANAKALLAIEMEAEEPHIDTSGAMALKRARHPLLTGEVVPIDLRVGDNFSVLLLTGPNTGGKTVALKTAGLFALMLQSGLQLPASGESRLPLFNQVFADIGDEQDIKQSLSTFSAHLKNIVRIVAEAGPKSLVLLDEAGAGTDPAEGAALAKAILSDLSRKGALVIASTHYGELKEFAYTQPGIENAAVEFDRETLRPTYRVLMGVPGSSNALYIAARLGLPETILEEARANLSHRDRNAAEVLQEIEASRARAFEMEREAQIALREAEQAREEYERRVSEVAEVQRTIRRQVEEEARAVLRRASEKAENLIAELRKANRGQRRATSARKELAQLRREVGDELSSNDDAEAGEPLSDGGAPLTAGDRVRVTTLGADGEVLEIPREGEAVVRIGSMRATLPWKVLRRMGTKQPEKRPSERTAASSIALRKAIHISPELMLRALRVEEAEPMLDRYLDDAYTAGLKSVRLVHGKGTGALRKFVHGMLQGHAVVSSYRLGDEGEGGDGVTIVALKE